MKFSGPSRSVALTLSEQLRRPRDIDGDPPGPCVFVGTFACRASASLSRE